MKKEKKEKMFLFIKNKINNIENIFLVNIQNADAFELLNMKKKFYKLGISIKMIKSKIIKKVYESEKIAFNIDDFKNSTFIVWKNNDDLIELSREIIEYKKKNTNFIIKSCFHQKKRLNSEDIEKISLLKSKKDLRISVINKILEIHKNIIGNLKISNICLFNLLKNKK